ncbi:DNA (cytosine-5)-methyltransferase 1 [Methylobacterium sp. 13MFTsu3.1M2]|nr:DNA (cytosine-5)-methyltransferase 1 [Methylobacterium sp. 13MFTsu3.1M2]
MVAGVVDLFCGAGGLTNGMEAEGLEVLVGYDLDPACRYPYEANNFARFELADVGALKASDLEEAWRGCDVRVLAGCAPCQPFSRYNRRNAPRDERWILLEAFGRLVDETRPEIVTMENVPELVRHEVHGRFLDTLRDAGYLVSEHIVECTDYGIPQQRRRLIVLASRLGPIELVDPGCFGSSPATVRDTISPMPVLKAGQADRCDPLHRSSALTGINHDRIRASRPGGSWKDWKSELVAPCHTRREGRGYRSVYGRMEWDRPAPTITTQAYAFGSGRFGHPEQDRALSLREAALLQTFPREYAFVPRGRPIEMRTIGRLIGNAVPPKLGRVVGRSISRHLAFRNHRIPTEQRPEQAGP